MRRIKAPVFCIGACVIRPALKPSPMMLVVDFEIEEGTACVSWRVGNVLYEQWVPTTCLRAI
jgi:hypothetical protein